MGGESCTVFRLRLMRKLAMSHIQSRQTQNPIKTNTISSIDKYNIENFPDLICAVHLDTSRQFAASNFGKPLVVRIHGNFNSIKACSN